LQKDQTVTKKGQKEQITIYKALHRKVYRAQETHVSVIFDRTFGSTYGFPSLVRNNYKHFNHIFINYTFDLLKWTWHFKVIYISNSGAGIINCKYRKRYCVIEHFRSCSNRFNEEFYVSVSLILLKVICKCIICLLQNYMWTQLLIWQQNLTFRPLCHMTPLDLAIIQMGNSSHHVGLFKSLHIHHNLMIMKRHIDHIMI
jgi:hypothetical protein